MGINLCWMIVSLITTSAEAKAASVSMLTMARMASRRASDSTDGGLMTVDS